MTAPFRFLHLFAGGTVVVLLALGLWQWDRVAAPPPPATTASGVQSSDRAAGFARVVSLQADASRQRSQGDSAAAQRALAEGEAILQSLRAGTPFDPEILRLLGINAYWLGQLAKDRNELAIAARHWTSYLELSGQLSRLQPGNSEWWIERSYALNNLGSLAVASGEWTRAAHAFSGSIALKERALGARPDDAVLVGGLADSYSWLGTAREALGQLDAAAALYAREMAMVRRVRLMQPETPRWIELESRALQRRAALALARGDDAAALADYRLAAAGFAGLTDVQPENRVRQLHQAMVDLKIEAILARTADAGEAAAATARMAEVQARLSRLQRLDDGKRAWSQAEAIAHTRLGMALLSQGYLFDARRQVRAGVARLDALTAGAAGNLDLRLTMAKALLLLAEIDTMQAQPESAHAACDRARGLLQETSSSTMDHRVLDPWVRVNLCLGQDAAAREGARRLHAIGYLDGDYRRFISNQLKGHP